MIYKLFLHKTTGMTASAPCIYLANRAMMLNSMKEWKNNGAETFMDWFDAEKVKKDIEELTVSDDGTSECKVFIETTPEDKKKYICIITSFDKIERVINIAHYVATENRLELFDAQKMQSFHHKNLYDVDFVTVKQRARAINDVILKEMKPVWNIRRLGFCDGKRKKVADYSVTLRKNAVVSFEKRTEAFYNLLKSVILDTETLITKNRCFVIAGKFYEISYTLEGYKNCADRIGYVSGEKVFTEFMHRMSCEVAYKWFKNNCGSDYRDYGYCMYKTEMVEGFPNPADRFVKGVEIKKQEKKEKFNVVFCGYYGGAISFKAYFPYEDYNEPEEISSLMIDDVEVGPLLKVISEFYPYLDQRFYESNHLPAEMMKDIVKKMKWVRNLIVNDTYNEELAPYIWNGHYFFELIDENDEEDKKLYNEHWLDFLYKHRYEAARLYDIFIEWTEKQLEMYLCYGDGLMFNVQGP